MATQKYLPNAPVTEALIDIRVQLSAGVNVENLASVEESIRDGYPAKRKEIRGFEARFEVHEEQLPQTTTIDRGVVGYLYRSADEKQVLQVRQDGFTYSKLRLYKNWEDLRDEAYRLWKYYVDIAKPETITRVALRYINHLTDIPTPIRDYSEYLQTPPRITANLNQENIRSFLTRVVVSEPNSGATAIVTQALESSESAITPIILDIDVFKESNFDGHGHEMWDTLENLRKLKNQIFFDSITEKTTRLYE